MNTYAFKFAKDDIDTGKYVIMWDYINAYNESDARRILQSVHDGNVDYIFDVKTVEDTFEE